MSATNPMLRKKAESGLSMNRFPNPNDKRRNPNDEAGPCAPERPFDIRASDFFRHLSFVIRLESLA